MAEETSPRWRCANCERLLPDATSICPLCDATLTIAPPRVENAGPYACPGCGLHFRAAGSVLNPQTAPWYVPQKLEPVCPHCQVPLADRQTSWALVPLFLLLFMVATSFMRTGAVWLISWVVLAFNISAERRWRNRPDRYAFPTQILESAGLLPTAQPFTLRRRVQLLWQMGCLAAGLHLLLMVLLPPLVVGRHPPLRLDTLQSAGWLLAAWLPAGLGWVLPRSRFKVWARGMLGLWVASGIYACAQGQTMLGLSFLFWAACVAPIENKLR